MLDFFYRKFFCDLQIVNFITEKFKILHHPHLDFTRFDFKEFDVNVCVDKKEFFSPNNACICSFLRFNSLTRDNLYYLSKPPKKALKHHQIYADLMVESVRCDYLKTCDSFLTHYHLKRIIICKYNKILNFGIPQKILLPKITDNFCDKNADSNTKKWRLNSETLTEIQKNMKHVYIQREKDKIEIEKYFDRFKNYTDEELINAYNSQKAIYGVHQQILYLLALDEAFKERFGKSPISNEENTIFGLTGKIIYLKNLKTFEPANEN